VEDPQRFEGDSGNIPHLARHSVLPGEAEEAILDPFAIMLEIRTEEEERIKSISSTSTGRIIVTVFTFRGEAIRPITAYDAAKLDEKLYREGQIL